MMPNFVNYLTLQNVVRIPFRCKHKSTHWSAVKKNDGASAKALEHFDEFYKTVYGKTWPNIRSALLDPNNKYMALVNNFSDTERINSTLENSGAMNLKALYEAQMENLKARKRSRSNKSKTDDPSSISKTMESLATTSQLSEVHGAYVEADAASNSERSSRTNPNDKVVKPTELFPIAESDKMKNIEFDRLIDPDLDLSMSALYHYVPATKLKGMEDYVLESEHYDYYNKGADASIKVTQQKILNFPKHLSIYTYEEENDTRFPAPRRGSTGVFDYYLLDGGSILPVLALDLELDDNVLDMCAAPGGKSLTALQTLLPGSILANDTKPSRTARIKSVMQQYVAGMADWDTRLRISVNDARAIAEQDTFNKILVDVPCTTDRHVLQTDENNIFNHTRVKERLKIPELQTAILLNALKIVRPGGIVVYSTCTLSPVQNDGVVQMALKQAWEETNSVFVVQNMSRPLEALKCIYKFGTHGVRYGHIVLPSLANNFGPMYFCKIVKVR